MLRRLVDQDSPFGFDTDLTKVETAGEHAAVQFSADEIADIAHEIGQAERPCRRARETAADDLDAQRNLGDRIDDLVAGIRRFAGRQVFRKRQCQFRFHADMRHMGVSITAFDKQERRAIGTGGLRLSLNPVTAWPPR